MAIKKVKKGKGKYFISFIIIVLAIGIGAIYGQRYSDSNKDLMVGNQVNVGESEDESGGEKEVKEEKPVEPRYESIKVLAIGDLLMHIDIVAAQYDYATGAYDFNSNFQHVKQYLEGADLSIANLETTLAGSESGYSGYPSFNTPDELGDAMKNCGIDVVSNMSNHTLDKGEYGFYRTRKILKEKDFDVIGTRDTEADNRFIIKDVKGIKVGITAYSYTTGDATSKGLNGIPISDEVMPLFNTFNVNDLENDMAKMKEEITKMRQSGAEAIIFYMHWGEEYQLEPNESQLQLAQFLADQGVDIIFGDHPHTIQPVDILTSSVDSSKQTVVFYSLGNFLSSQRTESVGNPYTEDGLIGEVEITKEFNSGEITIGLPNYMATWVKLNIANGQYYYQVVPAENNYSDYMSEYESQRAIESFGRTQSIVESYNDTVQVWNVH